MDRKNPFHLKKKLIQFKPLMLLRFRLGVLNWWIEKSDPPYNTSRFLTYICFR